MNLRSILNKWDRIWFTTCVWKWYIIVFGHMLLSTWIFTYPSPTTSSLWITNLLFILLGLAEDKRYTRKKGMKIEEKTHPQPDMYRQIRWLLYFMTELLASYPLKSKKQKQNLSYNKPLIHKPPTPKRGRKVRTF